jgi:pimeloyl-ACP methyl ester carboxylesterase
MSLKSHRAATILLFLPVIAAAQLHSGLNQIIIRGQRQNLYFLASENATSREKPRVLFSPGDGGWHGFAVSMAQHIAASGYDTYGFDTHAYLTSFTTKGSTLTPTEVMRDYGELIRDIQGDDHSPIILVGWSEGAGLALLATASHANAGLIAGVIGIGLPEQSILGWRTADTITLITKKLPKEPTFHSSDYLGKVAVPFFMIHARGDEYTSVADAAQMFSRLKGPKRFVVVDASNHRFDGARDQFFANLNQGLQWLQAKR